MKYQVVIIENFLFANRKVTADKTIYYLQVVKHYSSGKTYNECVFITADDYQMLVQKYGEKEKTR